MNRRKLLVVVAVGTLILSACSRAVTTQVDAVASIETASAMNATTGTYLVGDVEVELVKVAQLPGDELGLHFLFHSSSQACCSVFPRVAFAPGLTGGAGRSSDYVVILNSDVRDDGTLDMRLSDGGSTVPFTVDLRALNVALP